MLQKWKSCYKSLWLLLPFAVLLVLFLTGSVGLFMQALRYDNSCEWSDGTLEPVAIQGRYSEEGGGWEPFSRDVQFDYRELRNITLRGNFTRDIPQGEKLFLNICQLWVTLRVNGEEVLSFGPREGDGNPAQSIGNMWLTYVSPGISSEDEVELSFGNLYRNAYFVQFDNLLWNMHTGSEQALFYEAIHKDAGLLAIGVVFLILSLVLFMTGILLSLLRISGALQFFWLGLCTLFSALWFATLSPALSLFLPFPVFLNTLYSYSIQGIAVSIILFVTENLSGWRKKAMTGGLCVLLAALLYAIRLQMTGKRDLFSTIDYFSVLDTGIALLLIFCIFYEMRVLKSSRHIIFLKAIIPLVVLGVMEMLNGIFQWAEAGVCLGMGLFLFSLAEGYFILRRIRQSLESEKRALVLEKELAQSRISIMLSQIQPHFLYNTLLGMKELCDTEPQKASDALEHFAYYLRGNLDSLSNTGLIHFSKELEHVQDYLYLEKMRFEERIQINWEIGFQNFFLPPLTLQPIVENAVRYGITKKEEGGSLTVRSLQIEEEVVITVIDDGVGFDPDQQKADGRTHVGLQNVKDRLEVMCGGKLLIKSVKEEGTEVSIILPKRKEMVHEDHSSR